MYDERVYNLMLVGCYLLKMSFWRASTQKNPKRVYEHCVITLLSYIFGVSLVKFNLSETLSKRKMPRWLLRKITLGKRLVMETHRWQLIVSIGCKSVNLCSCNFACKFSLIVSCSLFCNYLSQLNKRKNWKKPGEVSRKYTEIYNNL